MSAFSCTSTNGAGLATTTPVLVRRDATAPTVTFAGTTSYLVDEAVQITCAATDATSGVASATCAGITGNAYNYAVGETSFSATATDAAGNVGQAQVRLTISVTAESLTRLVVRWVEGNGARTSLAVKLRNGDADGFRRHLDSMIGKSVSAENAAVLKRLSMGL